jgi:hypothetical protein
VSENNIYKLNDKGFDEIKQMKTIIAAAITEAMEIMKGDEKSIRAFKIHIEKAFIFAFQAIAENPENQTDIFEQPERP